MSNNLGQFSELLSSPLGDLISAIGRGVGEAQAALDEGSLHTILELYNTSTDEEKSANQMAFLNLLRSIGYQPTFYTLPETEVEAQVSLSMEVRSDVPGSLNPNSLAKHRINVTPINAGNTNRFGLNAQAVAKLKFKIVPVPPPEGTASLRVMPDVENVTVEKSTELLSLLNISYKLFTIATDGTIKEVNADDYLNDKIESQNIPKNTIISSDLIVELKIHTS